MSATTDNDNGKMSATTDNDNGKMKTQNTDKLSFL
jgi:hypothetical protein